MVKKFLGWLDIHLEEYLAAVTLLALTCAMTLQIIMRFVFHNPLAWPEEFCRYCFIYSSMFGLGFCIRHERMLSVDLLTKFFPEALSKALRICSLILCLWFFSLFLKPSWATMMESLNSGQASSATGFPTWIVYLAGPAGFLLACLRSIQAIVFTVFPKKFHRTGGEAQ